MLLGVDSVILFVSYGLATGYWLVKEGPAAEAFVLTGLLSIGLYLAALSLFDLYETRRNYDGYRASCAVDVTSAIVSAGLGLSVLFYLMPAVKFPRGVFIIQMLVAVPLLFLWRVYFSRLRDHTLQAKRIVILGAGEAAETALGILACHRSEYVVVGLVDDDPAKAGLRVGGYEVLGRSDDLVWLIRKHRIEGILVAVPGQKSEQLVRATLHCRMQGVFISDLLSLGEELSGRLLLVHARHSWFVFTPGFAILHHRAFQRVKRLTDWACATAGLILTGPVLLLAAVLVKLDSPGPVLFRQTRVGLNEKLFQALKLRTMKAVRDYDSPYTVDNDPRVTRVGKVLRFLHIDEIPQMWNVLRGDMSFIGPRAEWNILVKEYKDKIPFYSLRHVVRPGITGWAQVNYPYGCSVEDAFKKLEYDLFYVKNMSVGLDLKILFKTVSVVLLGKRSFEHGEARPTEQKRLAHSRSCIPMFPRP